MRRGPRPRADRSTVVGTVSSFKLSAADRVLLDRLMGRRTEELRASGELAPGGRITLGAYLRELIATEAARKGV